MELPPDLRNALEDELDSVPARDLAGAVHDLSQRYRSEHGRSGISLQPSPLTAAAYAAYRLPATFAALAAVLGEARERQPNAQPRALLDVGAGPGTAAWAAVSIWPDIQRIVLLERDTRMIALGKSLAAASPETALREATWRQVDLSGLWDTPPADLAIAGFVFGEQLPLAHADFVGRLWEHTAEMCVIVEPGTPRGFALIRAAGDHLREAGAHILAPFPQDWTCVEGEGDWCHFAQRVPRSRLHRRAKGASLAYEDEKFSYLVAARRPGVPIAARVVRKPQIRSGHIRLVLCAATGIQHLVVSRSQREAYRRAKDLTWGSAISLADAPLFGLPA